MGNRKPQDNCSEKVILFHLLKIPFCLLCMGQEIKSILLGREYEVKGVMHGILQVGFTNICLKLKDLIGKYVKLS